MENRVVTTGNRCVKIQVDIENILSEKEFPGGAKNALLIGYLSIAIEHQKAILLLIQHQLYGSASALVRPIVDTLFRALWINGCASQETIQKITEKDDKSLFPSDIVDQIDKQYASDGFFRRIKKESWKTMSSYAHSGLLPLTRRFVGQTATPNYEPAELEEIMSSATIALIMLSRLIFFANGRQDEMDATEKMLISFTDSLPK